MKDELVLRVEQLRAMRRYEAALKELVPLLDKDPNDVFLHTLKAAIFRDFDKPDEAIASLEEALRRDANFASAHNLMGILCLEDGRNSQAENHLMTALALEPENTAILTNVSRLYLTKSKTKKAIEYVEKGLAIEPNHEPLMNNLFLAYSTLGDHQKASEILKKNLERDPENLETLFNYGASLMLKKQYGEAEVVLASVLKVNPTNEEVIQTYKQAATANSGFYRWADGTLGLWASVLLMISAWVVLFTRVDAGAPSRVYWTFLLVFFLYAGWQGAYEGIGRLLAFLRQKGLRSQYHFSEMAIAISLPILLAHNVKVIWITADILSAEGPFPYAVFFTSIYISLLMAFMGFFLDNDQKASKGERLLLSLGVLTATMTFFIGAYSSTCLLTSLALFSVYFIYATRSWWR